MLGDEGFEHLHFDRLRWRRNSAAFLCFHEISHCRGVLDVAGEVGAVAQVPAAAHHRQVDAGLAALHLDRQDVHVHIPVFAADFHRLLVQHLGQR